MFPDHWVSYKIDGPHQHMGLSMLFLCVEHAYWYHTTLRYIMLLYGSTTHLYLHTYVSVCLPVWLAGWLAISPSLYPSIYFLPTHLSMYLCHYIYICMYMYIHTYIRRERERDREIPGRTTVYFWSKLSSSCRCGVLAYMSVEGFAEVHMYMHGAPDP